MLDEKRVKEAESNVKSYLEERLLWKYGSFTKEILETYTRNYQDSLEVAQKLFEQNLSPL